MVNDTAQNTQFRTNRTGLFPRQDAANPLAWSAFPLRYSNHAQERCSERDIPILHTLPHDSRLADLDNDGFRLEAMLFKITHGSGDFFIVLSPDGCVVTTFRKGPEWAQYRSGKERRRRLNKAC